MSETAPTHRDAMLDAMAVERSYIPQIEALLSEVPQIGDCRVYPSTEKDDIEHSIDAKIRFHALPVVDFGLAIRIRTMHAALTVGHDLTIRSRQHGGGKTELAKLGDHRSPGPTWYIVGWQRNEEIIDWMVVTVHEMRRLGLFHDGRPAKDNGDGSAFVSYPFEELSLLGCIQWSNIDA